ncbi:MULTISPECIES: lysophospholipid acyltransferase family protein [Latilactobacillus]|uniref:1-acyl-sn-glycerol-3-phosphate acyltransferase n=1 Tax=Latilactobacillus curvatus TaxID=28038 RepID=A0A1B2A6E9_LATCU|nr:1-acyl-sn-glycerol-3-phosphate acyltransferase [Latilactobacillus curvatus]ANJ69625.1 acyl-phosphate glycerol 3-phosphate acyltransferase [Latilactobacillus curvatus]ANY13581.1 acyl-phosphate glycerol 3-phosphate acyltransferase [Latilactobacillus curvatus]AOO75246.1 acyl-phosphate glycerol 3-phosphate acyltransferase [Latilactobacillus curvatus]ASN62220.1 1-acyl-sn-glycerol-3-phosphate acyltransferase [Latilactobacillus curvatus]AWV72715.1 1-acyl-sn-glycerol-3-phosphate acyltransferase [La
MFFSFARFIVRILAWLLNGNLKVENKEALPEGTYVLVGPHRTWWDPIFFALAASPRKFTFMAKEELFKNPILRFILTHANAFPVNRTNPGPSAIKTPVKALRSKELSLIMFPTGSRYSSELKGGAVVIAKMARVPLVPAVYQGPLKFSDVLKRKKITIRFGEPIPIDPKLKLNEENLEVVNHQMQAAFDQIDHEINPDFKYELPDKK